MCIWILNRDAVIYALSCERKGLPEILNLLSEAIHRPIINDHDVTLFRLFRRFS